MTGCQVCAVYRRPGATREPLYGRACAECLGQVGADLRQLTTMYVALPTALAPRRSGGGTGHQPPGPRLPVSLDALALLGPGSRTAYRTGDALPPGFLLREWATAWAVLRGLEHRIGPKEYATTVDGRVWMPVVGVPALAGWLIARLEWAAGTSDFPRFAREVHACAGHVRRVTGETVGATRPVGWCPAAVDEDGTLCLAPLSASTWVDVIECPSCSAKYDRGRGDWERLYQVLRDNGLTRR